MIELKGVSKTYGGLVVLHQIDLSNPRADLRRVHLTEATNASELTVDLH